MALDVGSMMLLGVLLSALTVVLCLQAARGFPAGQRRPMRIWTVALVMQPLAWAALSQRASVPPLFSIGLGTLLLMLSYSEMVRAIRSFHELPDWRPWLWPLMAAALLANLLLNPAWPNSSLRVAGNSLVGVVMLSAMAWSIRGQEGQGLTHAGRAMAAFALAGVALMVWRAVDHLAWPRPDTALLAPGLSDLGAFFYLNTGVVFLSLGFVLMHAERAYAALQQVASVDALTGVLARGALEKQGRALVAEARRSERPMSALLLDLDHFKTVNDRLGHEAGDRMLRHLAARARRVLRGEDLLCRLGGDEFVLLLPNTDAAGALIVAERLRESLAEARLVFQGQELPIPLSIGVADTRGADADLDRLIKRADEAMYVAKRAGGDRVQLA